MFLALEDGRSLKSIGMENLRYSIARTINYSTVGPDSSAGIANRYGPDGPGIKSRWRQDLPHLSRPTLGPTQPPIQWVPGLSWG